MKVSEYIAQKLADIGVTDVFGIPGGVILELLYAFDKIDKITPHLSFHEQCSGFAASGFAQVEGTLGVAYATRGPGVSNLITAIADCYFDSTPVLFITSHQSTESSSEMRILNDQDWDPIPSIKSITKYSVRVEKLEDVPFCFMNAINVALSGRLGPVCIDVLSCLFQENMIAPTTQINIKHKKELPADINNAIEDIRIAIEVSNRPVILIGDGINQTGTQHDVREFAERNKIPVLSSRYSADVMNTSAQYFGYIGSHGIRYSNFILSKADVLILLGNRASFPIQSKSYSCLLENKKILRFDIDTTEFYRKVGKGKNYYLDIKNLLPVLAKNEISYNSKEWNDVCNQIKCKLNDCDVERPVEQVAEILMHIPKKSIIVADVGNNEFWLSMSYVYTKISNRVLYSKSFGALGCSLGKAIGAYYKTRRPIYVFIGDQGLQMNIQELQFIGQHNLPIYVVLINDFSSGMIRQKEENNYDYFLHTTEKSGYGIPNFESIALAYKLNYYKGIKINKPYAPCIIQLDLNEICNLIPSLPKGNCIQDMLPSLDDELFELIDKL